MPDPPSDGDSVARTQSLAFGNAVHSALEWSARHGWRRPDEVLIGALLRAAGIDGADSVARAETMVDGWLGSELLAEIGTSAPRAEVPFALPLAGTIVRGKIDLLVDGAGRRSVIDFKTDELRGRPADELGGRYAVQRQLYALAASTIGDPAPVRAVHLFLEDPAQPVAEELGPLELAAARATIEGLMSRIRGGEFAPAPAPERAVCFGCPAAADLCPNAAWRPSA